MKKVLLIIFLGFLIGCVDKVPMKNSNSVFVLIKTKKMRFGDIGFIRHDENSLNLELFNSGTAVLDLAIKDKICINKVCYSKKSFNVKYLGFQYYDDFLQDIILKKPIYNKRNLKLHVNGFRQNIVNGLLDIDYKVNGDKMIFKDKMRKIVIKIQKIAN